MDPQPSRAQPAPDGDGIIAVPVARSIPAPATAGRGSGPGNGSRGRDLPPTPRPSDTLPGHGTHPLAGPLRVLPSPNGGSEPVIRMIAADTRRPAPRPLSRRRPPDDVTAGQAERNIEPPSDGRPAAALHHRWCPVFVAGTGWFGDRRKSPRRHPKETAPNRKAASGAVAGRVWADPKPMRRPACRPPTTRLPGPPGNGAGRAPDPVTESRPDNVRRMPGGRHGPRRRSDAIREAS